MADLQVKQNVRSSTPKILQPDIGPVITRWKGEESLSYGVAITNNLSFGKICNCLQYQLSVSGGVITAMDLGDNYCVTVFNLQHQLSKDGWQNLLFLILYTVHTTEFQGAVGEGQFTKCENKCGL